jgi:hypothetical protein
MISEGNQNLIAKTGRHGRGDAIIYEQDGAVSDIPGL